MHIVPALHGGQISGLRSRAAAYIRDTAQGQLNSVTLSVPAVLSLLSADLRSRSTWITSTQFSGSRVLVDVSRTPKASCRNPAPD